MCEFCGCVLDRSLDRRAETVRTGKKPLAVCIVVVTAKPATSAAPNATRSPAREPLEQTETIDA